MFVGHENWVDQFFNIDSPDNIVVPCGDVVAWKLYPNHNWVYNKIELSRTQGIECGPHGVSPPFSPVFSKPIFNLYGMGLGAKQIFEYDPGHYEAGHFWSPVFHGKHMCTDVALVKGVRQWHYAFDCHKDENGSFIEYHSIHDKDHYDVLDYISAWAKVHLDGFTGIVNFETIGKHIIDCHLHMNTQFIDLYGENWLEAAIKLYNKEFWEYEARSEHGYSCVYRTEQPGIYTINKDELDRLRKEVSSIQLTFKKGCPVDSSDAINDEYSYRLAIVNDRKLEKAREIIEELRQHIILTSE